MIGRIKVVAAALGGEHFERHVHSSFMEQFGDYVKQQAAERPGDCDNHEALGMTEGEVLSRLEGCV